MLVKAFEQLVKPLGNYIPTKAVVVVTEGFSTFGVMVGMALAGAAGWHLKKAVDEDDRKCYDRSHKQLWEDEMERRRTGNSTGGRGGHGGHSTH
jgi:hypothetical protein